MNADERSQVRRLRSQGLTYREIQEALGRAIPKSTLSYLCSGIQLTPKQLERLADLKKSDLGTARMAAVQSKARFRKARLESGRQNAEAFVGDVTKREARLALSMLYLGEGGKYPASGGLSLGSSDPRIVSIYIRLIQICFGIKIEDLKCKICYRADQDLDSLIDFWAAHTHIPRANFYKMKPDPRTMNKPTKRGNYKGVATIYHKGVDAQLELDHIADALLKALD